MKKKVTHTQKKDTLCSLTFLCDVAKIVKSCSYSQKAEYKSKTKFGSTQQSVHMISPYMFTGTFNYQTETGKN